MSWVGLRDASGGAFRPSGFGKPARADVDLNGIVARGSLLMELTVVPGFGRQTLLRYDGKSPWKSGFEMTLDDAGTLQLIQWQMDAIRVFRLPTSVLQRQDAVTVLYTWDAPARTARLTLEVPDRGLFVTRSFPAPMPLSIRDAVRISTDQGTARIDGDVQFLALADHAMPHGPLPTLAGDTLIPTPGGARAVSRLNVGDMVTTADGSVAQVRWAGGVTLPARGRYAPRRLRAPWFGARRDLTGSHDQKVRVSGSEVDYLFAADAVSANLGDLTAGLAALRPRPAGVATYHQILLDRPAPVFAGGVAVETFDPTLLQDDPDLRAASVLRHLPSELIPPADFGDVPVLRRIETLTLCSLRVA